jgi:4-oxalocrotonate tautomerase family enzyme
MPFVNVRIVKEVLERAGPEKRDEMSRRITAAIAEGAGVDPEVVWVAFEEVPAAKWYLSGRSVEQRWAEGK